MDIVEDGGLLASTVLMVCSLVWWSVSSFVFFFFKQKTAYEIGTGDWSSDVCSSDLCMSHQHALKRHGSFSVRDPQ